MTIPAVWNESWTAALFNHLWQSTMAIGVAALLATSLRKYPARVRYWVWFAASIKFLLPFSLLITAGEWLRSWLPAPTSQPAVASVVEQVAQPFAPAQIFDPTAAPVAAHGVNWLPAVLFMVWTCGALLVAVRFARGWRSAHAAKRAALPLDLAANVPVLCSSARIEPGIFGIFRPVLLLPDGIQQRLTKEQFAAIIAHEICHMRRRDNLTYAIHMIVETFFWFHPLVWWIGARLIDERERACDEAVVQAGGMAEIYAESILSVCKFYIESPLACVSGITGSDLKKRIARIMSNLAIRKIGFVGKLLIVATMAVALGAPVAFGVIHKVAANAQAHGNDWQKAAGGKQEFDVASVRKNAGGASYSNFPLNSGNAYSVMKDDTVGPNGSLFAARNQSLIRYIVFAYKLNGTQELALRFNYYNGIELHVPDWVKNSGYDIQARAPGAATKDQMRLMMQSLLAERFKLAVHWETRKAPVFALVEEKPGKLGPQIAPDPASDDCTSTQFPQEKAASVTLSSLPIPCGWIAHLPANAPGDRRFGGRNITLSMLAESLPTQTGLVTIPRPVIDRTGLKGGYDFTLEWTPEDTSEVDNHETGGTFREALKNQLGLRLQPEKGPVEVLVIDHVEQPSPN